MKKSWTESTKAFLNPKVIAMLFLGFSAGIPILLIFSTLSVWLTEADVARSTIGFFSWAALGYAFKFCWAPLVDRCPIPILTSILGRRRSWLLLSQFSIIIALIFMGLTNPSTSLATMATWAVVLGFSSATQDIVIDAYRIEAVEDKLQGLMSSSYIAGYRIGMLIAGAGALELAGYLDVIDGYDYKAWAVTYVFMAAVMLVGVFTTIIIDEPDNLEEHQLSISTIEHVRFFLVFILAACTFVGLFFLTYPLTIDAKSILTDAGLIKTLSTFMVEGVRLLMAIVGTALVVLIATRLGIASVNIVKKAYLGPVIDFFSRYGKLAFMILALVAIYRISDVIMGVMANVFYIDLGFEKREIGRISKGFGLIMTIIGGFLGGLLTIRYGVIKILFLGAVLAASTNLLFAVLHGLGNVVWGLVAVISADNLSAGLSSAAFVAYLSGLTNKAFTATQYALFSSLMLLLPKVLAGYSGLVVESVGYVAFFVSTAVLGIPVLLLISLIAKKHQ